MTYIGTPVRIDAFELRTRPQKSLPDYQRCVYGTPMKHGENKPDISQANFKHRGKSRPVDGDKHAGDGERPALSAVRCRECHGREATPAQEPGIATTVCMRVDGRQSMPPKQALWSRV